QPLAEEVCGRFEELTGEAVGVEVGRVLLVARAASAAAPERARGERLRGLQQEAGLGGRVLGVVLEDEVVAAGARVVLEERPVEREVAREDREVREVVRDGRDRELALLERLAAELLLARLDLGAPALGIDLPDPRRVAVRGGAEGEVRVD